VLKKEYYYLASYGISWLLASLFHEAYSYFIPYPAYTYLKL
jgi:hypothetical protein